LLDAIGYHQHGVIVGYLICAPVFVVSRLRCKVDCHHRLFSCDISNIANPFGIRSLSAVRIFFRGCEEDLSVA